MKLIEAIDARSNDYTTTEQAFEATTGLRFVGGEICCPLPELPPGMILPEVSVIIPALNSIDSLEVLLASLDSQSFLDRSSEGMEVVVVDDGSSDGTARSLIQTARRYRYPLTLVVLRRNVGRSKARNLGFLQATKEVLLFLDADVVAPPDLVENHVLRHALCSDLLLVSMREHIKEDHPAASYEFVRSSPELLRPDSQMDWRCFALHRCKGGESILRSVCDTDHWKSLGCGESYVGKGLSDLVLGVCLSVRSRHYEAVGGFCPKFVGWGREDAFFGASLIAAGLYVVPFLNAVYHIRHPPRSGSLELRAQERANNAVLFDRLLQREAADVMAEGRAALEALHASRVIEQLAVWPALKRKIRNVPG